MCVDWDDSYIQSVSNGHQITGTKQKKQKNNAVGFFAKTQVGSQDENNISTPH